MKYFGIVIFAIALAAIPVSAADHTWTGKISDSMCGATHQKMSTEHGNAKMSDRDCTMACIKEGGKYVFVSSGKVYTLDNQDFAALSVHAGHMVKLSGVMTGDSIKVSKITMPAMKAK